MQGDRGPRPIHPLLFAAFPVLLFTAHNRDVASPSAAAKPLIVSVATIGALQLIADRWLEHRRIAIVLSTLAVVFFSYGHVRNVLETTVVGRDRFLLPVFGVLACLVTAATFRTDRPLDRITGILNTVGTVLVVTGLVTIGIDLSNQPVTVRVSKQRLVLRGATPPSLPDIYYLIFDRYPDATSLRDHFGFDNAPFLRSLERNGFTVISDAKANYQNTHLSLASSLNMSYLDGIRPQVGASRDVGPAFRAIGRSAVPTFLKEHGYRYVHVGSWWSPTSESPTADVNLRNAPLSEFDRTFYSSTALSLLTRRGLLGEVEQDAVQRSTTPREFASLERAIQLDGPKFVFAHFLVPHPPYVFDRDGRPLFSTKREGNIEGFLEQVRFTNARVQGVVKRILARPGDPVVIMQADEGPYPSLTRKIPGAWASRPDGELRVKYGILSAFLLPKGADALYPTISPVNAFRVVFNAYFDTRLPLLADRSYASRSSSDVYDFVPLGERVRSAPVQFVHHG